MTTPRPTAVAEAREVRAAWRLVAPRLDAEARLVGGWFGAVEGALAVTPPLPPGHLPVRLVFALPSSRVAGLKSYRDQAECWEGARQVVAFEAGTLARMLLRAHGGTVRQALQSPALDRRGLLTELRLIASRSVTPEAVAWCERAGTPLCALDSTEVGPWQSSERLARLEAWLTRARRVAG